MSVIMRDEFRKPDETPATLSPLPADPLSGLGAETGGSASLLSVMTGRPLAGYEVERRIYGYVIRRIERLPRRIVLVRAACWVASAGMCVVSAELLRSGAGGAGAGLWGAAAIVGALLSTVVALRLATRGLLTHVEVDLQRGELREVLHHRIGRESLIQRISFDAVKALRVLPRAGQAGPVQELTLYCHIDTPEGPDLLEVASGTPQSISALSQLLRQNVKAVPVTAATAGAGSVPENHDGSVDRADKGTSAKVA